MPNWETWSCRDSCNGVPPSNYTDPVVPLDVVETTRGAAQVRARHTDGEVSSVQKIMVTWPGTTSQIIDDKRHLLSDQVLWVLHFQETTNVKLYRERRARPTCLQVFLNASYHLLMDFIYWSRRESDPDLGQRRVAHAVHQRGPVYFHNWFIIAIANIRFYLLLLRERVYYVWGCNRCRTGLARDGLVQLQQDCRLEVGRVYDQSCWLVRSASSRFCKNVHFMTQFWV